MRLTPADGLTPPAAPSGLAGSVAQGSRVKLTWTDNATNETGFRIERAVGSGGQFTLLDLVGADVTSYGDKTTMAGNEYRYRVLASNSAGRSAWSKTKVVVP